MGNFLIDINTLTSKIRDNLRNILQANQSMINRMLQNIRVRYCLLIVILILIFCSPQVAISKTFYLSCYTFGEEKLADDFYIINTKYASFINYSRINGLL